ncbi:MAG: hypothetical protein M1430_03620 [Betaproteobacteria bacterium]|nr:hypothetical protein [Betaproteobacteria bacterium]
MALAILKGRHSMFYAISWFLSFTLMALWSLACWGLYTVAAWAVSSAGVLKDGTHAIGTIFIPEWLRGWIPPELAREFEALIAPAGPMIAAAIETVPALSGAVTVVGWAIWGLGAMTLVAMAIGAHALISLFKRRGVSAGTSRAAFLR